MDGRPVKMFAGPRAVELETQTRTAVPFSLNQPDRIHGNQRVSRVLSGMTVHASGQRGFGAAHAWLGSTDVRAHLQSIASLDAAYGLHVLERQLFLVAAAVQLDMLVPALVALATSLEAMTEPEPREESTLPPSLAPLMRFRELAVSDDLDRAELFETLAQDVRRVAREVAPFVAEITEYLKSRVWTTEMHCLSDLLELVREARLSPTIRTAGFPCPCCRYLTLLEPAPGTFVICPVCFWEDDEVQFNEPANAGGANTVSLGEARADFQAFGAASREFRHQVRSPRSEEMP